MLECTFLGHQTWHFQADDDSILIDPVLLRGFGNSKHIEFEVYPPREIDIAAMPAPRALFLSHEHLDHFHLPSISKLDRSIPFYVGPAMPNCVSDAVRSLGFSVIELEFFKPLCCGSLEITLHPAALGTIFWERRVVQFYIRNRRSEASCFLAVDALSGKDVPQKIRAHGGTDPNLIVVSNNSMLAPPRSSTGNALLHGARPDYGPSAGLSLVNELIRDTMQVFGKHINVAICGDGHVDHQREFGPFLLSDQREIAAVVNTLCGRPMTFGPYPGEVLNVSTEGVSMGRAAWIKLNEDRHLELKAQLQTYMKRPDPKPTPIVPLMPLELDAAGINANLVLVEAFLPELARTLLMSPVGAAAVRVTKEEWPGLMPRRILLRLLSGDGRCVQYALNVCSASFEPDDTPADDLLQRFPFGVEMFLGDLAGVLRGEIQIWDISGRATNSWQIGSSLNGVEAVLLCLLGEQVRPDLHRKLFESAVERLQVVNA